MKPKLTNKNNKFSKSGDKKKQDYSDFSMNTIRKDIKELMKIKLPININSNINANNLMENSNLNSQITNNNNNFFNESQMNNCSSILNKKDQLKNETNKDELSNNTNETNNLISQNENVPDSNIISISNIKLCSKKHTWIYDELFVKKKLVDQSFSFDEETKIPSNIKMIKNYNKYNILRNDINEMKKEKEFLFYIINNDGKENKDLEKSIEKDVDYYKGLIEHFLRLSANLQKEICFLRNEIEKKEKSHD